MSGSLCGVYSGNSSWLIFLKSYPQCGSVALPPVFSSVSPKAGRLSENLLGGCFDD
jgi:hypothetical protein